MDMNCSQVKDKIVQYLDGACEEQTANSIAVHLSHCLYCAQEYKALQRVNQLLNQVPSQLAPTQLWENIKANLNTPDPHPVLHPRRQQAKQQHLPKGIHRKRSTTRETIRDLVLAAAVSLVLFCHGGSAWQSAEQLNLAGLKVEQAVTEYLHFSDFAVNHLEELHPKIQKERNEKHE